jgi:hypothetical protein
MSKKRVPSYRLHKPSGQAVVTLGGKDFYPGRWNSEASVQEYNRLSGKWMANGRRLVTPEPTPERTIVELLAAYLTHANGYCVKDGKRTGEVGLIKLSQRLVRQSYEPRWPRTSASSPSRRFSSDRRSEALPCVHQRALPAHQADVRVGCRRLTGRLS